MPLYTTGQGTSTPSDNHELPQRTRNYLQNPTPEGSRDVELFNAALQYRDNGFLEAAAEADLIPCAIRDGFNESYARRKIRSAYSRSQREACGGGTADEPISHVSAPRTGSASVGGAPTKLPPPITEEPTRKFLEALYRQGERVGISGGEGADGWNGKVVRLEVLFRKLETEPLSKLYPSAEGIFIRINPMEPRGNADKDVTSFRHVLIEFDLDSKKRKIPKQQQYQWLVESGFAFTAIVDSGGKSLHGIALIEAEERKEYDERVAILQEYFNQFDGFDPSTKNPSRYSRLPGGVRKEGLQQLLALQVGPKSWQEWQEGTEISEEEEIELRMRYYRLEEKPFPQPMAEAAFYGIAGRIVKIIEADNEPCRENLLAHFLVFTGNYLGRNAHLRQGGIHHLNEYLVIAGETAKGAKGTGLDLIRNLFEAVDPQWTKNQIKTGFTSGEAIIDAIADPPTNSQGAPPTDKRLLMVEEEYGRFLTASSREGSTISHVCREGWDSKGTLSSRSRHDPRIATNPHISQINHVTPEELRRCLKTIENTNGFANRNLWIASRATKIEPTPPWIHWETQQSGIVAHLARTKSIFDVPREFHWDKAAQKRWREFYRQYRSRTDKGLVGPVLNRTLPHVCRLAMIYCALDQGWTINLAHLEAAIAFWDYSERTVRWLFTDKTGNPHADKLLWELQHLFPAGLTKTEIRREVFNTRISATEISQALKTLIEADLVLMRLERAPNTPRRVERWYLKREASV
jgi:Protein of unknown function (DUF3987)